MLFKLSFLCSTYLLALVAALGIPASVPVQDGDLATYVSRPDLPHPIFHIEVFEPDLVSQGYWFVAPYSELNQPCETATAFQHAIATGPQIYDAHGNLVWSGAHLTSQLRSVVDFKVSEVDQIPHLSLLVHRQACASYHPLGVGLILDPSFNIYREVDIPNNTKGTGQIDMHEFNLVEDGKRALMITQRKSFQKLKNQSDATDGQWIANSGFVEVDISSREIVFEWWSLDFISPDESFQDLPRNTDTIWDWLHLNSIDKNSEGDYLVSARYTNTIYKISGVNGSIIWRLGGKSSSFQLEGFNFSSQHDARFREYNETTTLVTFLNNAADRSTHTSTTSTGMLVGLDTTAMTATLLRQYPRPDKELTRFRGNLQVLPNSNVLVGWSENGFTTEYTTEGRHILDARFVSQEFVTYRAYKFNFTSKPIDKPVVKAFVHGETPGNSTTAFYVSWNGATEVASWRFFAQDLLSDSSALDAFSLVGTAPKTGFETTYKIVGYSERCYVEAIGADGTTLGGSKVEDTILPADWQRDGESLPAKSKVEKESQEQFTGIDRGLGRTPAVHEYVLAVIYQGSAVQWLPFATIAFGSLVALFTVAWCSSAQQWRRSARRCCYVSEASGS